MRALIVTGASGGHIFPALSIIDNLKAQQKNIHTLLVLPKRSLKTQIAVDGYNIKYISTPKIELRPGLRNPAVIFGLLKGSLESFFILFEFRPDIVIGFGSLDSVPLILLAWLFRIRTLIHEQNVIPGKANRLLAMIADKVATSFFETRNYLKINPQKIVFTGNPLRPQLKQINEPEAVSFFGLELDKITILIMGGSQGSQRINQGCLKAISLVSDKSRFQVIHISGPNDYDLLNRSYKNLNVQYRLFTFLKEMQYAYSCSCLVVCRAGATTIAELINFKLPAVLIPYPFAYQHQYNNARILEDKGCAIIVNDTQLEDNRLREVISGLIDNPDRIKKMRSAYKDIRQNNANDSFIDEVISLVKT
jgi:UDP-N-acetylglucosamine--N-acetylmuramyl-(pentapeptide) pyrophosphoryl-undecaprenol N-acetylglucosamine transferase